MQVRFSNACDYDYKGGLHEMRENADVVKWEGKRAIEAIYWDRDSELIKPLRLSAPDRNVEGKADQAESGVKSETYAEDDPTWRSGSYLEELH